ncbi:unnamed protein product [Sympodiomycopsis kandeliae]
MASEPSKKLLTFVTGNANKLREVQEILLQTPSFPYKIVNESIDVAEIQGTIQEVAHSKCLEASSKLSSSAVITEDTALVFDAFNGDLPGPYIKDFLKNLGLEGLNTMLKGFENKNATAICTFAYSSGPGEKPILFQGRTRGRIVPPRGENRFGWDPIFEVQETGLTYAEMQPDQKNKLSHRYKALEQLRDYLSNQA